LAITLFVFSMIVPLGTAWAVVVPAGTHTFDGNLPGNKFVQFTGGAGGAFTPGPASSATFGVSIDSGALHQNYPGASFNILSGFIVTSAFVVDTITPGTIVSGDSVFATIGGGMSLPSTFDITDGAGIILSGSFSSGTFSSTIGATAGSLSASDVTGLVLTPGPAFTFDTSFVSSIALSPTGFSISLSSIPVPVSAASNGPEIGGKFIPANLGAFGPSTGSVVVSGSMNVVANAPEPSSLALAALGLVSLVGWAWRRRRFR
jgi:hypothetical protein